MDKHYDSPMGARIRDARKARGLTQEQLAAAVGVTRSAVAQWETDRSGQVSGNLSRIAAALGVGVEHLLMGNAAVPGEPDTADEIALLRLYREANPADRQLLLRMALRLVRTGD
jgi:transcriptional regulator with XRE-family HTH domain